MLLSCYGKQGATNDNLSTRVRLLNKLKQVLSCSTDKLLARSIVHGFMFDAWSSRKSHDEFLTLNIPWILTTDVYLTLIQKLDLHDELLCVLQTVPRQEVLRFLKLVLDSPQLSENLLRDLFSWTVDMIIVECCRDVANKTSVEMPTSVVILWVDRVKEQETCRQLLQGSLQQLLNRLWLRLVRLKRSSLEYWSEKPEWLSHTGDGPKLAFDTIQKLLTDIVRTLLEHIEDHSEFVREHRGSLELLDELAPGFSDVLPVKKEATPAVNWSHIEATSRANLLRTRHQEDMEFAERYSRIKSESMEPVPITTLDDHQMAFITVCNTLQRYERTSEFPPNSISMLGSSRSLFNPNQERALEADILWVEEIIRDRLAGWQSFVKLKLQFFAVFDESSINEDFADLICACDLQWELCEVLTKYVRRHQADATRMPFERVQLGCELLLSVFSKTERMRYMLRDHLYQASRSLCTSLKDPLFGSWRLWRIDLDIQLIAILNQLVVKEGTTVPQHVVESLVKISLIAPYQVIAKVVQNAIVNRGQCATLLQVLVNIGQLPWLRASPKSATLLVAVLRDLLCNSKIESTESIEALQEHHNLVEFVKRAVMTSSPTSQVLLDPKEFLEECIPRFMEHLLNGNETTLFPAVSAILMEFYGSGSFASAMVTSWLDHEIHYKILLLLLRLRTMKSGLISYLIEDGYQPSGYDDELMEDICRVCDNLVVRMTSYMESATINQRPTRHGVDGFLEAICVDEDQSIDLESRLTVVPLLNACRQYLDKDPTLPELPFDIQPLCRDYLRVFEYQGIRTSSKRQSCNSLEVSRALTLMLGVGRVCGEVLADVLQAIRKATKDIEDPSLIHLREILIPALYRTLSVSSRSETQRLLTQCVPMMANLWGGLPRASTFWDIPEDDLTKLRSLEPYWNSYIKDTRADLQESEVSLDAEETLLILLRASELLLRQALEPLPPLNTVRTLEVCCLEVGYDLTADQIAPLIVSSVKALPIDWATAKLDLLLYCFLTFCRLSHIAAHQHRDRAYPNRHGPHSTRWNELSVDDWIRNYGRQMSRSDDKVKAREQVARAKAREELVLAAMHFSEDIVRRHDRQIKSSTGDVLRAPMANHAVNKRTSKGRNRGGYGGAKKRPRTHKGEQPDITVDDGTKGWLHGIGTLTSSTASVNPGRPPRGSMTVDNMCTVDILARKEDEDQSSVPVPSTSLQKPEQLEQHDQQLSTTISATPDDHGTPPEMLSQEQINCLMVALSYLPDQEQQALKRRFWLVEERIQT
ncbi:hypothetical protein B0O80DRAFT_50293 [Mortierella sp. GBAus27b]|nr:hypothetical protein B0O80DRAFT_50293 [Mortierella sp. GBAus27b]